MIRQPINEVTATMFIQPSQKKMPLPDSGVVDIWFISLQSNIDELAASQLILSSDEWGRAMRFVDARDRERFAKARWSLRNILARYLTISPENIVFSIHADLHCRVHTLQYIPVWTY